MNERQAQDKRIRDTMRFLSTFGQRENEVAAIIIFDAYRDRRFACVNPSIFAGDSDALFGFDNLKRSKLVSEGGIPTREFWRRCDQAEIRDSQKR